MNTTKQETGEPAKGIETAKLRLERRADGFLVLVEGDKRTLVRPRCCFPWSKPGRYLSLRDDEDKELAFICELSELDPDSRSAVEQSLTESVFVLTVTKVESSEEDFEIRNWKVDTRQGPRTFQTKIGEWPIDTPGGGLLFRDVAGDLFLVEDPESLDEKSWKLLSGFLD
jgi:hypothetical protein